MKTNFLLIPLMGLSILTGCKEDEQPTWEEYVRDSFNYNITINIEQDPQKTAYIWPIGCYPVERKGNFYFDGLASDFVLANAKKNDSGHRIDWQSEWGTLPDLISKAGEIGVYTFESGGERVIDSNNSEYSIKVD